MTETSADDTWEDALVNDPRFAKIMDARQRSIEKDGGVSLEEVERMIANVPD